MVLPKLVSPSDVDYPVGAHGDAVVILVLTIAVDGAVIDAATAEGAAPFSDAAVTAARGWRFEPAKRDGKPVASKVRFEVRFEEPKAEDLVAPTGSPTGVSSTPAAASSTAPRAPSKPRDEVEEVLVRGLRAAIGGTSLGRAEVRQLPGAFGDPFRAIDAMPGVTPIVSGLPFFYIRGAPPGNVGYFLDGIRVPYLFHVGLGPSVIHPGMVERVDLYPGGYPAEFGRFAGGIVSAETTAPRTETHGEGNIRLFDAGALVETGFAGGKGTALVAGRYSYTAAMVSLLSKGTRLDYRDFEARVTYDVTPRDRLSLVSFGAYDLLGQDQDGILSVLFGSEFYRLDLRHEHRFGERTIMRSAVTFGLDQAHVPGQPRNQRDDMVGLRTSITHPLVPHVTLRGGGDAMFEALRADLRPYADPDDPTTQQFNALFPPRNDTAMGVWGDVVLSWPRVEVVPGVRFDLFRSGGASAIGADPRIASRLRVAERVHVLHTFGLAHQPPSFIIPIPGLAPGNLQGGLQKSIQSSAGVEVALPDETTATVTVFDNVFLDMSDTLGVTQRGRGGVLAEPRSLGSAVGAELYVKRRLTRRVGGYVSYTLSRSTRSIGSETFPSAFDRTHVANAAVLFDLGRNWRAGTRFTLYTGVPTQSSSNNGLTPPPRVTDPPRDPLFYRVDVRFEKRWTWGRSTWLSFVAECLNATLHKEVLLGQTIGPVTIPSLGVEGGF